MPAIPCFMIEPTDQARYWLRRYRTATERDHCAGGVRAYHNAMHPWGDHPYVVEQTDPRRALAPQPGLEPALTDPDWPVACTACGTPFREEDPHQLFWDVIYRRAETGETWPLRDTPAGAMWDAVWMADAWAGPDGRHLVLKTPAGEWGIDGPSKNSDTGWSRTGIPPRITANPSILVDGSPGYHGWLRDGVLIDA